MVTVGVFESTVEMHVHLQEYITGPHSLLCSVLQGVCTLEGEEHGHREAGSDPESSALDAGVPAQHADARTKAVHATVHRHHHQEIWDAHLDLSHAGR